MDFSSIKSKALIGVISAILFIVIMVISTLITINSQKKDGLIINLAGKQRMLTQKMTKEVLEFSRNKGNIKNLKETVMLFDKTLNGLIHGDKDLQLPPTTDKEIVTQLEIVQGIWKSFKKNLEIFINNTEESDIEINYLLDHNLKLLKEMDKAVQLFENKSSHSVTKLIIIQFIFLFLSLILGYMALKYINRKFVSHLIELQEAANSIAEGNTDIYLEETSTLEFNNLIHAFVQMAEKIEQAKRDLLAEKAGVEKKVEEAVLESEQQKEYLAKSISKILEKMTLVANGDLTVSLEVEKDDEIGKLYAGFNQIVNNLREIINTIVTTVHETSSSANLINQSSDELAAGAEELSSQSREVSAAVEEMTQSIQHNARTAVETVKMASSAGQVAQEGGEIVEKTVKKIKEIAELIQNSTKTVEQLGESSNKIGEIILVISEIADQTNLLALNAAIEAARAGEHGKGFAVVAEEVKKLAERTSQATQEITSMITNIQNESAKAVEAMQNGNVAIKEGTAYADEAGKGLEKILHSTEQVIDLINQTASANEEQAETSQQISQNVESISEVAEKSARDISQIAFETNTLIKITANLEQNIAKFRL